MQSTQMSYVKRFHIKGQPDFERLVLNDDLQDIIRHIPTNTYQCASILRAVAKGETPKRFDKWFNNSDTISLLNELDTNPENSPGCSKTPKSLEELKQSLFFNVSNKDMPDKYKYLRGYYCPQILVHELGGWANKRYRIKLLRYLENHYTDEQYETLSKEKSDLQQRFDALMANMDAMRNDMQLEFKHTRKQLKAESNAIKAVVRKGCKTTTTAAKEIERIASADSHLTSNFTTGMVLIHNDHPDMPFGNKPTKRLKFRAIEQGTIKGGTYKREIERAWKVIPHSHPKDAFKIIANEMKRLKLSIPISNTSNLYWHGNTKEIRIYDEKLPRVEQFIDSVLPGLLKGDLAEIGENATVIQESTKQILNDI